MLENTRQSKVGSIGGEGGRFGGVVVTKDGVRQKGALEFFEGGIGL